MNKYLKLETRNSKPETRNPKPGTLFRASQGMTLIEVMVASLIGIILTLAFYSAMNYQQKTNVIQDKVTKAQGNLRVALSMLERDVRMAGFGLNEQLSLSGGRQGIYPCDGCGDGTGAAVPTTRSDSIEIWANFNDKKLYTSAAIAVNGTGVSVGNDPTDNTKNASSYFKKGDYLVLRDPVANKTEARLITVVAANQLTVSAGTTNAYPINSEVRDIKRHTYAIDGSGNLTLTLVTNTTTGATSGPIVAENIEDIQFAYGMDNTTSDPDGVIEAWVNDPLADGVDNDGSGTVDDSRDLSRIVAVRITILARTDAVDKSWADAGKTPPFLRQGIENHTASTTPDGYRRRLLEKTIFVRNLGLSGKYLPIL